MGITGLIPFVKSASRPINIKEFAGCTVAIDSYCWLHKGAFSCADKLVKGEATDQYVVYCLKFVNMLLSYNIKPIMVFDGRHLPAKAETEKVRRERRKENKEKAIDLLRLDRGDEARALFQRCVDVTHEMALQLIKRCRAMAVDCIVAPYEADAQLAYLNITGIAHVVITEDSDLLLFGCTKVLFKMDAFGNGLLVEKEKLPIAMKLHPDNFSMDKFRHMCILSGCDYLPSLPGIGLVKACKFIKRTAETNMVKALSKIGAHLNMPGLTVSPDYREKFLIADSMFKHQPVFDPLTKKIVPLTPLPPGVDLPIMENLPPDVYYQLALGNLEPFTLKKMDSWDPSQIQKYKTASWSGVGNKSKSIWSDGYVIPQPLALKSNPKEVERPTTRGKMVKQSVKSLQDRINSSVTVKESPKFRDPEAELEKLRGQFGVSPPQKKICLSQQSNEENVEPEDVEDDHTDNLILQILKGIDSEATSPSPSPRNPFSIQHNVKKSSGSVTPMRALAKLAKIRKTVVDDKHIVKSRFFYSNESARDSDESILNEKRSSHEIDEIKTDPESRLIIPTSPEPTSSSIDEFQLPDLPCGGLAKLDFISKLLQKEKSPPLNSARNPFKKRSCQPRKITDFVMMSPTENSLSRQSTSPKVKSPLPFFEPLMSFLEKTAEKKPSFMLKSPKHVGLKRRKSLASTGPGQPSIFEMFAFQPKTKISTKDST